MTESFCLGDRPIAIDNTKFLSSEGSIRLKPGLKFKIDYIWVKKLVWEQLLEWYGGGPILQRRVLMETINSLLNYTH